MYSHIRAKGEGEKLINVCLSNVELKRQLATVIFFDMRMQGVIGATSLLLETSLLSVEQQEYVAMIQNSSKSLLMLVNDILDLTKLQSSRLRIECENFSLTSAIGKCFFVPSQITT